MNRAARLIMCAAVAVFVFVAPSSARVFWTIGGGRGGGYLDEREPGWQRAYAAELQINGGRADLTAWDTSQTVEAAVRFLRERVSTRGDVSFFSGQGDFAWGLTCGGGAVTRFLVVAGDGNRAHVFQVSQSFSDFKASTAAPNSTESAGIPDYPGGTPHLVLGNRTSGLSLATIRTADEPSLAVRRFASTLRGAGWTPLLPESTQSGFYVRGRDILAVSAVSSGEGADTVLTWAHKRRTAPP